MTVRNDNFDKKKSVRLNPLIMFWRNVRLSVSFETDYPSVLQIVESAGIALESRSEIRGLARDANDDGWSRPFIS